MKRIKEKGAKGLAYLKVNEDNIGITDRDASTLLKYAIASGSIDMNRLKSEYDMSIKQKYLEQHSYVIYEGKDGEWYTYLPDSSKKYNRKLVHRKNKEALEKVVCDYYAALEEKVPTFKEAFELMQKYTLSMKQVTDSTYLRRETDFKRFFEGTLLADIPVKVDDVEAFFLNSILVIGFPFVVANVTAQVVPL